PRGLRSGATLGAAAKRFQHGETLPQGTGALYGDAAAMEPPYGMMVEGGGETTLYYAIPTDSGTAALVLRFMGGVLVSMGISYL
ncbi:MAG TPA: hypothetical protein VLA21_04310, partial [Candidatus Limnocylindria bacterium]|nr:hypothetical protein [Candidatus Limnocylindria bacterium]